MVGSTGGLQLVFPAVRLTNGRAATLGKRRSATQWTAAVSSSDVRRDLSGIQPMHQIVVSTCLAAAE